MGVPKRYKFIPWIRLVGWIIEVCIGTLFLYAYITLTGLIVRDEVRFCVRIVTAPLTLAVIGCLDLILAFLREEFIDWLIHRKK